MKGRGCKACGEWDGWDGSLQVGAVSVLDGGPGPQVLLDHRGIPFPPPSKLVGYERRVRIES